VGSTGYDVFAPTYDREAEELVVTAFPNPIHTGLSVAVPEGYDLQVRGRSGLATKGVLVVPGTIDSDYRGELIILMYTTGQTMHVVKAGDRIAQLVLVQLSTIPWREVDELPDTVRGKSGFGSTGR